MVPDLLALLILSVGAIHSTVYLVTDFLTFHHIISYIFWVAL